MTKVNEQLYEWICEHNEEALTADGYEDAIMGMAERCSQPALVVYDAQKCIGILMGKGMSQEEAEEYFSFNVKGAWMGEHTPLFLWRRPPTPEESEWDRAFDRVFPPGLEKDSK